MSDFRPGSLFADEIDADLNIRNDILLLFGDDGDGVIVLNAAGLAADEELTDVIVGTSGHQGTAPNSLIIANRTTDGDMLFLVSDGGNSLEFMLANADVADLQLGHGMATMTLKTASGDMTLNPAGVVVVSKTMRHENDVLETFGTDDDFAQVLNSAGLAANTELTGVIVGNSIYATAIPANSMIFSNVTNDSDIVWFINNGTRSIEAMRIDASTRQLLLPSRVDNERPTLGFGDGTTGIYVDTTPGPPEVDELSLIAGSNEMLRLTRSLALANYVAARFNSAGQVSLTSASDSTWRMIETQPVTVDWDGGVTITALNGMTGYFDVITNTANQATTVTNASTVYIAGAPVDGSNVTHTNDYALYIAGGNSQLAVDDGVLFLGLGRDIAMVLNSAGLAANTELTDVIIGTSVYGTAIPANSLIISSKTDDADIVFFFTESDSTGNSQESFRINASEDGLVQGGLSGSWGLVNENASRTNPSIIPDRGDTNTGIGTNSSDRLSLIAGAHAMLELIESTALANYVAATFDAPDQVSLTSASGSTWRMIQTQPVTVDWDGGVTITALDGMSAYFNVQTNTADVANPTTVTKASTVYIAGAPTAGSNITQTYSAALEIGAGHLLLPLEDDAVTPTLAFGEGNHGFYSRTEDSIDIALDGAAVYEFDTAAMGLRSTARGAIMNETASATNPVLVTSQDDPNTGIGSSSGDQLSLIAGGHEIIRLTETISTVSVDVVVFDAPNVILTDSASDHFRQVVGTDMAVTLAGTTQVTQLNRGMGLTVAGITVNQSGGAVTMDEASSLHVPIVTTGTDVTITNNRMISTGVSDCYLTVGGVWTDTVSTLKIKTDVETLDYLAMPELIAQIHPHSWIYNMPNVDDGGITRYGIISEQLPHFLSVPGEHGGSGISAAVLGSFNTAAIRYHEDRIDQLERENTDLRDLLERTNDRIVALEAA